MNDLVKRFHAGRANSYWVGPWLAGGAILLSSCSTGPSRVGQPSVNAGAAARAAIEEFDVDGDALLSEDELKQASGLRSALARWDTDSDGKLSAAEIAARIESWQSMGVGLTSFRLRVLMDGRALPEAAVVLEPAPFLGEEFRPATAVTDAEGFAMPSVPKELRGAPDMPPGVAMGLYRVRISKQAGGSEQVPARYNTETILGQEVAFDVPEIRNNQVVYELRSQ